MLDIGWSEMLLIAVVAILVVGPRELPRMLRSVGQFVNQARKMAGEFQSQFNEALKDTDLDEIKKGVDEVRNAASKATATGLAASINPLKSAADEVKSSMADKPAAGSSLKPAPAEKPDVTDDGDEPSAQSVDASSVKSEPKAEENPPPTEPATDAPKATNANSIGEEKAAS